MSYIKIWIHFVWNVKNDSPLLSDEIRSKVTKHIRDYGFSKGIFIDTINGYHEHLHCLISMQKDQSPLKIMNLLKGESSHWINQNSLCKNKFEWREEYFAVSVSESTIEKVRAYINNQEEHHRKKSFKEECNEFFDKYKFDSSIK